MKLVDNYKPVHRFGDPNTTIVTPIYRDITKTLNETKFWVYVHESYMPVVHRYYIDHPEVKPINIPDDNELDNYATALYPLTYIIDMLANGVEFGWKHPTDIPKSAGFLESYLKQFEGVNFDNDPEQKAFVEKVKGAYDRLTQRANEQQKRVAQPKKRLTLAERIAMLGPNAL